MWRLIEVPDDECVASDLTDDEVVGIGFALRATAEDDDVYDRAWKKVGVAISVIIESEQ